MITMCLFLGCTSTAATPDGLCARASSCEAMDVLVSPESCAQQVKQRLINAPDECSDCVLSLPCAGMVRVATGNVTLGQICPSCPTSVTSKSRCGSGHEHLLTCGIATRMAPAASASALPSSATPPALPAAPPAVPAPPAAPTPPLPVVPPLPIVPLPTAPLVR